ncbi:hypothetical protein J6590_052719 [Homalodisca vitripennis]|nr:hypothetical protein J6590_052719 [Homalodisca vitripennis]
MGRCHQCRCSPDDFLRRRSASPPESEACLCSRKQRVMIRIPQLVVDEGGVGSTVGRWRLRADGPWWSRDSADSGHSPPSKGIYLLGGIIQSWWGGGSSRLGDPLGFRVKGPFDHRIRLPDLTQEHLPSEGRPQAGELPTRTMSGGVYSGSLVRPVLPPGFPEGDPSIPVSGYPISTRVTQTPILRIHRGFPPEGRVPRSHRGAPPAKRRPQVTRVAAGVLIIRRSQTRADGIYNDFIN